MTWTSSVLSWHCTTRPGRNCHEREEGKAEDTAADKGRLAGGCKGQKDTGKVMRFGELSSKRKRN